MVEINLLPHTERRSTRADLWRSATYALPLLTAAAILFPELTAGGELRRLRTEQDRLQGEIAALTPAKQEYDGLLATQRTLEEVTKVAGELRDGKTYWTNDLAAFAAQLPSGSGVAITSMSVKPLDPGALATLQQSGVYAGKNVVREIDLAGTARSQQSVVAFLNTFENSPNFAVNFRSLQREGETGRYTFAASVGLVGQPANSPAATPGPAAAAGGSDVQ